MDIIIKICYLEKPRPQKRPGLHHDVRVQIALLALCDVLGDGSCGDLAGAHS